ncbi:MAG: ATP-binding protein [Saprospiraceae bacterium]
MLSPEEKMSCFTVCFYFLLAELHDDMGGTLSGITLYSHLVNDLLDSGKYTEAKQSANIIQQSANEMNHTLRDLIWAFSSEMDTPQKLIEKIDEYIVWMAKSKNIKVHQNVSEISSAINLPSKITRNIYLIIKEAINNAVKHSQASELEITIKPTPTSIFFSIKDNGIGFDIDHVQSGHGLITMKNRSAEIKSEIIVISTITQGTTISLVYIIPHPG